MKRTRKIRRIFLREWRKEKGLTQVQLAQRLEGVIGQSSLLSKLENGLTEYTQGTLEAVAEALGIDPTDLIGRLPGAPRELTLVLNRLTPDQRRQAVAMIEAFAKAA